MQRWFWRPQYL